MFTKSRIYEKNLFKNIYSFPIIFSKNKYNDFEKLCKNSTKSPNLKLFDFLYSEKYPGREDSFIDYVFNRAIEEWLVARNNEGPLNYNDHDFNYEDDFTRCVKCHKYFSNRGSSRLDNGGICPRKGCDAVYTYDCDCEYLKYEQIILKRDTPYDEPCLGDEDDPEEYDIFRNLDKNPSINNYWKLKCTKCGCVRSVESNW